LSNGEVPLARLWKLPDGTCCLLLKDPRADTWELRVVRDGTTLRRGQYGSVIVAMDEGKQWRAPYDSSFQSSSSQA
jgi:hypothetical protein